MNEQQALIIFVKNPVKGKVKTRLAQSVGNEKALEIYLHLLKHTFNITKDLPVTKYIFYSDFIEENDLFDEDHYIKKEQSTGNLGLRMSTAFQELFKKGHERVIIIGSDCLELKLDILKKAFECLKDDAFVVGSAKDGGYYLLGMSAYSPSLFEGMTWSHDKVFAETIARIQRLHASYYLLPTLSDVDTIEDLEGFEGLFE